MENKSYAMRAGLFTIALTVALIAVILWFQRDSSSRIPVEFVSQTSVAGLSPQSAVRYRGVEVGKVNSIELDRSQPGRILIRASMDPDTPLTKSSYASLGYQGVTGLAFVQLDDTGASTERLSARGPIRLELQPGIVDRLTRHGEVVLKQVEQTVQRINQLVEPGNQQALVQMFKDVSAGAQGLRLASEDVAALRRQLSPTLERLPQVTARAQQALAGVDRAASSVTALSEKLGQPDGVADQVGRGVAETGYALSRVAGDTIPRVNTLADEAARSSRALTRVAESLNEQPQSLLFGKRPIAPGPGEPGFVAPAARGGGQ